jgi:hypothetical protein
VYIADNSDEFIASAERELAKNNQQIKRWLSRVDAFLKDFSWDYTVAQMMEKISDCMVEENSTSQVRKLKSVA